MICYMDRTFCRASVERCVNEKCARFFGDQQQVDAQAWWGSEGAPVAFADFSATCGQVVPPKTGVSTGAPS